MNTLADDWFRREEPTLWAWGQTNTALRDDEAIRCAEALLLAAGLPTHPDRRMNWSTFLALFHAIAGAEPFEAVLDVGADRHSVFVPALLQLGFRDLTSVNSIFDEPVKGGSIQHHDMAMVDPMDRSYVFISYSGDMMRGKDAVAILKKAARLLCPGGLLFLRFEYNDEPAEVHAQHVSEVRSDIRSRRDIADTLCYAEKVALYVEGSSDFGYVDQIFHSRILGLHDTFGNLLLRRGLI
jgi:hypothetical protein